MSKNNKKQVKPAQESVNQNVSQESTMEAMMKTTLGQASLDRNHQVDLLKMMHERFYVDEDAVKHTGFSQNVIDKLNHISALGIATVCANEINSGNSDFAIILRKAALPELKEAFLEIGASLDETKLIAASTAEEAVTVPSTAVEVSEETKKKLDEDAKARKETAGKSYDPTKIKDEGELKSVLSGFLAMNSDSKLMDSIMKSVAFYSAWNQVQLNRKIDSANETIKSAKNDNEKKVAEKSAADAKSELEAFKKLSKSDIFRKVVELTGRTGTLVYGLGAHLFNVTAASGSPVSAFCELYAHSADKETGKSKYSNDEIADVIKSLVYISSDDVRKKGQTIIEEENKLPEKDRVKTHIETGEKNIRYADRAIACVTNAPSEYVTKLKENFLAGDNISKKSVLAIKRAFYSSVPVEMMSKVKLDSMLDNATQYAGVISNLFRNPSDPLAGYSMSNITDLEFKTDDEIKAENDAAAEEAKKAAEEKAKEDAKKEKVGKAKAKAKK